MRITNANKTTQAVISQMDSVKLLYQTATEQTEPDDSDTDQRSSPSIFLDPMFLDITFVLSDL